MSKAVYWLRFTASLPLYLASIIIWILAAKPIADSFLVLIVGYLTPYRIGQVLGYLLGAVIIAAVAYGVWLLARYVRTASFRRQPKPAPAPWP